MREQLIQYVSLLFAGAQNCEDIKQEILQNTLDRYDDLISEGKAPEAAYRLAIVGIGDINEILGSSNPEPAPVSPVAAKISPDSPAKKLFRAIAIGLYIISPLPLFILSEIGMDTIGLCGTLCIVAVATVLIILGAKKKPVKSESEMYFDEKLAPKQELRKAIHTAINTIGIILYFVISFITGAWLITWIIFPIMGAVWGLTKAILDLKEEVEHET